MLQNPQVGLTKCPMKSLLCSWSHCMWILFVPFKSGVLFPPVLWSSCTEALLASKPSALGLLLPKPDPKPGEPDLGLKTLTLVREHLQYNYFPVCRSPTWRVCYMIILWKHPYRRLVVASFLSLGIEYLFWKVPISFVGGYSAVSCDFGVFVGGG